MSGEPNAETDAETKENPVASAPLKPLRLRGSVTAWAITGVIISIVGLFLVTGLAGSPWLFLLYPVLIGVLLLSLSILALHLLHRL